MIGSHKRLIYTRNVSETNTKRELHNKELRPIGDSILL